MLCLLHISVDYDHKFYKSETTELHQQSVQTKQDTLQTSTLYPVCVTASNCSYKLKWIS